ncbi:MAG: prefoldin subunit alpha [Thermoprotei archaeon]|nr:MAG: prefoldin subunit alpha [Thermoprotei archaeon]
MLSRAEGGKVAVPLEAVLAELTELKRYIDALQTQINGFTAELEELSASRSLIAELKARGVRETVIPTDRGRHVMVRARLAEDNTVLAHVGLDYYVRLSFDKAIEILNVKESDIREAIKELQKELSNMLTYYQQLQAVVNRAVSEARQGATRSSTEAKQ